MQKSAFVKAVGLGLGALMVTACSSTGNINEGDSELTTKQETETAENGAANGAENGVVEVNTNNQVDPTAIPVDTDKVSGEEMEAQAREAEAALMKQTVFYFDFDQSSIKQDGKSALIAHATYLSANSSARVALEGHADERGTVEYNLALGERRAMAVRRFLMANGASADQLEVVSYGEERPAVTGHNEASWAENRRVVVNYR
jgi:peptidoglycan-associated lipoprotein